MYTIPKKYLKQKIMSKDEYMEWLTTLIRRLRNATKISEIKIVLDACDRLAAASGWTKDKRQLAPMVNITFGHNVEDNKPKIKQVEECPGEGH